MSAEKDTRRWTWTKLTESAHDALLQVSTEFGRHPSESVADAVDFWLIEMAKKSKSRALIFHAAHTKDRERQTQLSIVKQLIVSYQKNPSDEGFDEISSLCNILGESLDKLIEDLNESPHISEVLKSTDMVSKAEMWLLETMQPDKPIASKAIKEMAAKQGFGGHIIDRAKDRLNTTGKVSIMPFKQGSAWFWRMKTPDRPS